MENQMTVSTLDLSLDPICEASSHTPLHDQVALAIREAEQKGFGYFSINQHLSPDENKALGEMRVHSSSNRTFVPGSHYTISQGSESEAHHGVKRCVEQFAKPLYVGDPAQHALLVANIAIRITSTVLQAAGFPDATLSCRAESRGDPYQWKPQLTIQLKLREKAPGSQI